jgi:tripartite ATP-independent transporter DctM subunit
MDYAAWIGLLTFIGMFVLLLLGVPIWLSLAAAAFAGSMLIGGPTYTFQQFSSAPYYITATFNFAVVPLFILMSVLAADCGVAESAYDAASKWMGKLRGGLLIATVFASAVFGACCGMGMAAIAVFTKISLPVLTKNGYDKRLSMGCISTSGALSSLIPPSVPIIIFCILLEQSIGRALVAGIIPGIVYAIFLVLGIAFVGIINPKAIPKSDVHIPWKEKFASLSLTVPIVFVVLLVIGGIYFGIFAPTVGGAIGSVGVLIIAAIRRIKMKTIAGSFYESILINAQIYPMVIGGFLFARFVAFSGLPGGLMDVITASNLSPMVLMLIIVIFYLFVGCVLEFFSMVIITLPIVFPLLTGVGFDPIALIIILILLGSIAGITPPIGMGVFIVASVANTTPEEVFKGIIPFFIISMIHLWLIIFFPEIATWLPKLFYG